MTKIEIEMMRALAAYSGPVKRCRPGKARGADLPKKDDRAQQWLNGHRDDVPLRDERPSVEGGEWRGPNETGSQGGMRQCASRLVRTPQQPKWQSINKQR
jgi:hypothetical protein